MAAGHPVRLVTGRHRHLGLILERVLASAPGRALVAVRDRGLGLERRRRLNRARVTADEIPGGGEIVRVIPTANDVLVAEVLTPRYGRVVMKAPLSPAAAASLDRHVQSLDRLHSLALPDTFCDLVPRTVPTDEQRAPHLETALGGGAFTADDASDGSHLLPVVRAMAPLHRAGQHAGSVAPGLFEEWIREPLRRIATGTGLSASEELALEGTFAGALMGRELTLSWIHGDLSTGNVLMDQNTICGLVDWENAHTERPPMIDLVHLYLTATAEATRSSIGARTIELLESPEGLAEWLRAVSPATPGADELDSTTAILLGWLTHVDNNLSKSERYGASRYWMSSNVVPVVDWVVARAATVDTSSGPPAPDRPW